MREGGMDRLVLHHVPELDDGRGLDGVVFEREGDVAKLGALLGASAGMRIVSCAFMCACVRACVWWAGVVMRICVCVCVCVCLSERENVCVCVCVCVCESM